MFQWLKLLFRHPTLRICDPEFGDMIGTLVEFGGNRHIHWEANINLEGYSDKIRVSVYADERGPSEGQRLLWKEIRVRLRHVRNTIENPLAAKYECVRQDWKLTSPALASPSDVWKFATLFAIEINMREISGSDFVLDHQIDWDADHDLNVVIKDWEVIEVSLEG